MMQKVVPISARLKLGPQALTQKKQLQKTCDKNFLKKGIPL